MAKITILGSGGFGIGLAVMFDRNGHDVTVWSAFENEIEEIRRDGEHKLKLPGVKIPESVKLTADMGCISGCEIVLFGIPSPFILSLIHISEPTRLL